MTRNPFNNSLDWTLQGKYARVHADHGVFEGWVDRIHHQRGSIILHDCTEVSNEEAEDVGSVFIRTPELVTTLKPQKQIEWRRVESLTPHPDYEGEFTPSDDVMRRCYRNQFAGSFPVVTTDGVIINGHKRITAAKTVGLERHPVEIVDVTDEEAAELLRLAHRDQLAADEENATESDSDEKLNETG